MRGSVGPFMFTGFGRMAQRLYDRAAPAVAAAFEVEVVPVAQHAADNWPVNTGHSRGLVFMRIANQDTDTLTLEYGSEAEYAGIIRDGAPAEELIFSPVDEIARSAAEAIGALLGGIDGR